MFFNSGTGCLYSNEAGQKASILLVNYAVSMLQAIRSNCLRNAPAMTSNKAGGVLRAIVRLATFALYKIADKAEYTAWSLASCQQPACWLSCLYITVVTTGVVQCAHVIVSSRNSYDLTLSHSEPAHQATIA